MTFSAMVGMIDEMKSGLLRQTTTNKMADPSELEQSTPQKSQHISGKKRNNPDSPDSYSPSDKQLLNQF
jgi:hypothetical protein